MKSFVKKPIPCPEHLHCGEKHYINEISRIGKEHFAFLPYYNGGEKILISETSFVEIKRSWEEDRTAILVIQSAVIRRDGILIPEADSVRLEEYFNE